MKKARLFVASAAALALGLGSGIPASAEEPFGVTVSKRQVTVGQKYTVSVQGCTGEGDRYVLRIKQGPFTYDTVEGNAATKPTQTLTAKDTGEFRVDATCFVYDGASLKAGTRLTVVAPPVSITAGIDTTLPVGKAATIKGRADNAWDMPLTVERRSGSTWVKVASGHTDDYGYFRVGLRDGIDRAGTYTYRVVVAGKASTSLTLRRTPLVSVNPVKAVAVDASATLTGQAKGAPRTPFAVQVQVNGKWSTSKTGTTDAAGRFSARLTYGANKAGTYRFRAIVAGQASNTVTLKRTVQVRISAPGSASVGARATLNGQAKGAPRKTYAVQALAKGKWSTSRTGTTDAAGRFSAPLTYGANKAGTYRFRVVVAGQASNTVTLKRTPVITVSAPKSARVGARVTLSGQAKGAPRRGYTVQALVNGRWSTSRTGTTNAAGRFSTPLTYGANTAGTYRFRVVVDGVASRTVTVTRTKAPKKAAAPRKATPRPRPVVTYKNCAAVRAAGKAPLHSWEPGYALHLDRDKDGVACEPYRR